MDVYSTIKRLRLCVFIVFSLDAQALARLVFPSYGISQLLQCDEFGKVRNEIHIGQHFVALTGGPKDFYRIDDFAIGHQHITGDTC